MRKAIWAIFHHYKSTDELPRDGLCPEGPKSWCKYNKAVAEKQKASFKHRNSLPEAVRKEIKPTFNALSYPSLLRKCLHGKTLNVNESLRKKKFKKTKLRKRRLELQHEGNGDYEAGMY